VIVPWGLFLIPIFAYANGSPVSALVTIPFRRAGNCEKELIQDQERRNVKNPYVRYFIIPKICAVGSFAVTYV